MPSGAAWARNPVPRNDHHRTGEGFPPLCREREDCSTYDVINTCLCSGRWGPYQAHT